MPSPIEIVRAYHQRSKHHFHRYAPGPGGLDWRNQPDPFRTFAGSPALALPLLGTLAQPRYPDLYRPGVVAPQPLTGASLAACLELAFGLSAWKQYGDTRWALRCNPSSGNLHPTEAYVLLQRCAGCDNGVYHYVSRDHSLEQRCVLPVADAEGLLPTGAFLVGLSSIHWREAWKYGERAYRYCQHDVGHAIAALRYAAAVLGWQARLLHPWSDRQLGTLLGLERREDFQDAEPEQADVLLAVTAHGETPPKPEVLLAAVARGRWQGRANALSPRHSHHWPVIETVAEACRKPRTSSPVWRPQPLPPPLTGDCAAAVAAIIRQRRSAQALDARSAIDAHTLCRMLDLTLPRAETAPFDALPWAPRLHLLLFVHRVTGLPPGLYLFLRRAGAKESLQAMLSPEFDWAPVPDLPARLELFRLVSGDTRDAARSLSCHQDIAADGAFSLAMLAEYDLSIEHAPWVYRELFWEAGVIGQVLYLEAEAAGIRGTGIGCYFDDGVHRLLGLDGTGLQSMYHFTVGGALADDRLQTLPAYAHLPADRAAVP